MNKKIQKIIAIFLLCILTSFNVAWAEEAINVTPQKEPLKDSVELSRIKKVIPKDEILKLKFAQKFNANKAVVGDKVNFVLAEDLISNDGKVFLPKETLFIGVVEKQIKSKSFNRNARILLTIKQVKLPSGELVSISARVNKKKGELKSPVIANLPKLMFEAVAILGAGMIAATVVIIAAVSTIATGGLAGIVMIAPVMAVTASLGVVICTASKGVNYKASPGKPIQFVLQDDMEIYLN